MAVIRNQADTILQATSPRLLSNPLNYISIIPSTNTITSSSGSLLPSTISVKAILNGSLKGTISWSTSPVVAFTNITDGIIFNSSVVADGAAVIVTATLTFNGNNYTATTTITRKQAVSLSNSGTLTGEGGGSITNLDYSNVSGTKPPATATSNFFSTSTSDPVGGSDGDAHYNSTTNVMWFKVSGTWKKGGTVNASQITVGTLAAARIAAGSIDATKLSVSSLAAITANLGTVNAGDITGTANINIAGNARFSGSTTDGSSIYTVVCDAASITNGGGLKGYAGFAGVGVYGDGGTTGSRGIAGVGRASGVTGVQATNTASGSALDVTQGYMTINSTTLVSNLNADMVDGLHATKFVRTDVSSTITGSLDVDGDLRCNTFRIDATPTTGSALANFAANKPGGTSTVEWFPISCNGVTKYLPVWG